MAVSISNKSWKAKDWTDVVNVDVRYRDKERSIPEVCVWRRTAAGKSMVVDPDLFPSYFYVPLSFKDKLENVQEDLIPHSIEYPAHRSIEGKEMLKLVYERFTKSQFAAARQAFPENWEADIKYRVRYHLDNNIKFSTNRRICYFDIETDMCVDAKFTPAPVLSIAVHDSMTGESGVMILDRSIKGEPNYVKTGNDFVVRFGTENEMLKAFIKYMKIYNPDILCAYNLYEFDFPYLINRMKVLGINYRELSEINEAWAIVDEKDQEANKCHCGGRELLDWYVLVKKLYDEDKPDTYKLDDVADKILGERKTKHGYKNLKELYDKDLKLFIEYNLQDVILIKKMEEKTGLITKYMISLQQLVPMPLEMLKDNSVVVDFYMMKTYHGKVIFPSKKLTEIRTGGEEDQPDVQFKGAITGKFIVDPVTGLITSTNPDKKLHKNIMVLDFAGLYPNIFRTFNVSPETKCMFGIPGSVGIEGIGFNQDRIGLLPALFGNLIELRKTYQDVASKCNPNSKEYDLYFNLSTSVKKVANSVYGVTGFKNFRLYDIDVAKSITGLGQEFIKFVYTILVNELGYEVIYSDTDSCFVVVKSNINDKEAFIKEIEYLEEYINKKVEAKAYAMGSNKNYLKMDFEKRFTSLIFMGVKKRYLGLSDYWKGKWLDKPKFVIKGYDLVRREMAKPVKILIKKIIQMYLDGEPVDKIKDYYNTSLAEIKNMSVHNLAWSKGLGKSMSDYIKVMPQHIKACYAAQQYLGISFKKNDSPKLMYIQSVPIDINGHAASSEVIAFERDTELPQEILNKIDYTRYIKSFITNKLDDFVGIEGMNMEYVLDQNTKTLNDFTNIREDILGEANGK